MCKAQEDSLRQTLQEFPERSVSAISDKLTTIDKKLSKQTLKALRKFERQEAKLQRKLAAKDSTLNTIKENAKKIEQLQTEFTNMPDKAINKLEGEYNAYLDTLQSTFKFLQQKGEPVLAKGKLLTNKLDAATSKLNVLQGKFQKAEDIKRYLRERREILKQQLEKFGMIKQLKRLDKSVYYYSQYINEYKSILKDKKKLEQKAMSLLYKIPTFKKFVEKNSYLQSLFPQGAASGNLTQAQLIQGLQSRANVQDYLRSNVAAGGPNVNQLISKQLGEANNQLNILKNKISKYGGDGETPSFKPNNLKTKSFLKRIEYGTNIQLSKSSSFFPTTSDIALSLGYKVNDNSVVGIGVSYKLGLGKSFTHMKLTSEGIGIRSYADWKIKGQFFISGGYEQNYLNSIKSIQQLKDYSSWVSSGLIGISKKYNAGKKLKGKIQLLYDFLSNTHIPKTQTIIFRTGFNFK